MPGPPMAGPPTGGPPPWPPPPPRRPLGRTPSVVSSEGSLKSPRTVVARRYSDCASSCGGGSAISEVSQCSGPTAAGGDDKEAAKRREEKAQRMGSQERRYQARAGFYEAERVRTQTLIDQMVEVERRAENAHATEERRLRKEKQRLQAMLGRKESAAVPPPSPPPPSPPAQLPCAAPPPQQQQQQPAAPQPSAGEGETQRLLLLRRLAEGDRRLAQLQGQLTAKPAPPPQQRRGELLAKVRLFRIEQEKRLAMQELQQICELAEAELGEMGQLSDATFRAVQGLAPGTVLGAGSSSWQGLSASGGSCSWGSRGSEGGGGASASGGGCWGHRRTPPATPPPALPEPDQRWASDGCSTAAQRRELAAESEATFRSPPWSGAGSGRGTPRSDAGTALSVRTVVTAPDVEGFAVITVSAERSPGDVPEGSVSAGQGEAGSSGPLQLSVSTYCSWDVPPSDKDSGADGEERDPAAPPTPGPAQPDPRLGGVQPSDEESGADRGAPAEVRDPTAPPAPSPPRLAQLGLRRAGAPPSDEERGADRGAPAEERDPTALPAPGPAQPDPRPGGVQPSDEESGADGGAPAQERDSAAPPAQPDPRQGNAERPQPAAAEKAQPRHGTPPRGGSPGSASPRRALPESPRNVVPPPSPSPSPQEPPPEKCGPPGHRKRASRNSWDTPEPTSTLWNGE
eukprot:TRINITY_DN12672_c1_g1_i4.p1 TRINITY_DN12672_c1_g1~~TRINITY_DN12672_c1_g1_i4.p1  ORF type:complete len:685 (+),score=158.54 TRINITY_DN12672_c1_g1_i4:54-2108(+)